MTCIRWTTGFLLLALSVVTMGASHNTQQWIETLQSDADVFAKARACQQLGEFGTEKAVPALATLLDHRD